MIGKVKFFHEDKGWGFITRADGQGDVFVHRNDIKPTVRLLREHESVEFDTAETERGMRAVNVMLIKEKELARD